MAEYNEVGVGRYNRLLQRLLQIKADPPVPVLGGELLPMLALESDALEWEYLRGGRLLGTGMEQNAVAAQASNLRMRNPAGSNVLVRVESLMVSCGTASVVGFYRGTSGTNLTTAGTAVSRDSRASAAAAAILSTDTNQAPSGNRFLVVTVPANTPFLYEDVVVLGPGSSLDILTDANVTLRATLWWRERAQEESEA